MEPNLQIRTPDDALDSRYIHVLRTDMPLSSAVTFIADVSTTGSVIWAAFMLFFAFSCSLMFFAAVMTILKGGPVLTRGIMASVLAGAGFGVWRFFAAGRRHMAAYRDVRAGTYRNGFFLFDDALLIHTDGTNTLLPKGHIERLQMESRTSSDADGRVVSRAVTLLFYRNEQSQECMLELDGNYAQSGRQFFETLQHWHSGVRAGS